ncbi:hypothetical protein NQ315_002085 [Exocentrus adspersus]|uniref:Integrase catalytic domain-containing protein n=1 Tax=Exocentrus adspersus TaxID=1586481 RepID=A0AAV8V6G7_9CUCU|nr:hypothetical protein NQ315_002085 [Exocentrus adspersus]
MEVYMVNRMTALETEEKIKDACDRWELPKVVVADNATQFLAANVQGFFRTNGVKHITTPVANPASNGSAENAVKTFKTNTKIRMWDPKNKGKSLNMMVSEFLFSYRTAVHCTTRETPAKLFLGRPARTKLDMLRETKGDDKKVRDSFTPTLESQQKAQDRQITNYGGRRRSMEIGEAVMVTDYRTTSQRKWTPAEIISKKGRGTAVKEKTETKRTTRGNIRTKSYAQKERQVRTQEKETSDNTTETVSLPEARNGSNVDVGIVEPETTRINMKLCYIRPLQLNRMRVQLDVHITV